MSYYSTHSDLVAHCRLIEDCGIDDWDDLQAEAYRVVNRDIEVGWYRRQADARDIDYYETRFATSSLEDTAPLKALEVFKLLELAGEYLSGHPGTPEARDRWQEVRDRFRKRYEEELDAVLTLGLDYDWDTTEDDDIAPRKPRSLIRA